ncbi:unnamed protein product, partial [Prorocentrum cordatum]
MSQLPIQAKELLKYRLMQRAIGGMAALQRIDADARGYWRLFCKGAITKQYWDSVVEVEKEISHELDKVKAEAAAVEPTQDPRKLISEAMQFLTRYGDRLPSAEDIAGSADVFADDVLKHLPGPGALPGLAGMPPGALHGLAGMPPGALPGLGLPPAGLPPLGLPPSAPPPRPPGGALPQPAPQEMRRRRTPTGGRHRRGRGVSQRSTHRGQGRGESRHSAPLSEIAAQGQGPGRGSALLALQPGGFHLDAGKRAGHRFLGKEGP